MRAQAIVHEKPARAAVESQTLNGASGRTVRQAAEMDRVVVRSGVETGRRRLPETTDGRARFGRVSDGRIPLGGSGA